MSKACVAGMASRQGQNRHRIVWVEVVRCDSSTPEIVWISGRELDKPCPPSTPMKITSKPRARCSLGLSFNAKLNTVPMYLPASFTPFFALPLKKLIFSLSFCTLLFFFISWGLSLNWTWTAESPSAWRWKAEKESGERRERWRRKNSAGGGHRRSFSPRSLFSWHTTARLPQRPCFPSEYSPSLPPL